MSPKRTRRQILPVLDMLETRLLLTTYYPDLLSPVHPSDNPTLPGGMDTFSPPVDSQTPSSSAPTLAEWTRTAGPDDTLAATGDLFSSYTDTDAGKDTEFLVYGQTSGGDGTLKDASIQRLDGLAAAVTLDAGMNSGGM